MNSCVIVGGGGYVGWRWGLRLAEKKAFDRIILADLKPPIEDRDGRAAPSSLPGRDAALRRPDIAARCPYSLPESIEFIPCDVRKPIEPQLPNLRPEWIFNFAAVHREPGHERREYFDTNLPGARNVCAYADVVGCKNILFTSSIAVYGPTNGATTEASPFYPTTAYGISKLCAELVHEGWRAADTDRRLIICRPGVVYGPGDPGNILRMIQAVKKGYFVFPGGQSLRKSYAYIEGLLDSFEFTMSRPESRLTYNYVERETEELGTLVKIVQEHLDKKIPTFTAPLPLLAAAARMVQIVTGGRSAIHPARVRKAAMSTHIVPQRLLDLGFKFRYDFRSSLQDWAGKAPEDFS